MSEIKELAQWVYDNTERFKGVPPAVFSDLIDKIKMLIEKEQLNKPTDSGISNKPFKQASEFLEEMVLNEGGKKHELPELRTSREYKIMVKTIEKYAEQFSHQQPTDSGVNADKIDKWHEKSQRTNI